VNVKANICIAANPDTAIHAARLLSQTTIIHAGDELTHLGLLSIKQLDCSLAGVEQRQAEEIYETFALWGVRTFRDLAELPLTGVAERLGQEGVRLQQLAQGRTDRALNLVRPPIGFEQSLELEHPVSELEPLSFILSRLLNQLCANLNEHALAANELRLQLVTEKCGQWPVASGQNDANTRDHSDANQPLTDHLPLTTDLRIITLPVPMRNPKTLLRLLLFEIEREPPSAPITAITIIAEPVKPRAAQTGLFIPLAPEPEKLEITLARLAKLVGGENVGSPELLDTHRPDAFRVKRFSVTSARKKSRSNPPSAVGHPQSVMGFRIFRPPWLAQVHTSKGQPIHVDACAKLSRKLSGQIVRAAGPWRGSSDWWRTDVWARDEWDVAVFDAQQGGEVLCRIYRDLISEQWYVAGIYD
jgi:protein ImuB